MFLALTSDTAPMYVLDDYAETVIAPRVSMISGVSQVQVQGAQKYAVRVQVDPDKLHVGQRVSVTGTLVDRQLRVGSLQPISLSCSTYNSKVKI